MDHSRGFAVVVFIASFGLIHPQESLTKCTLQKGKHTYNVVLSEHCESSPFVNQLQNDNQENMKNFLDINVDHTRRIQGLENAINKLLNTIDGDNSGRQRHKNVIFSKNSRVSRDDVHKKDGNKFKEHPKRVENQLLNSLHKEFVGLRRELTQTKRRLRETQRSLTDARKTLGKTQQELEATRVKLRDTERQLEISLTENLQMRKECETTQSELVDTKAKLKEAEKKIRKKDIEVWRAKMEQEDLRKALEACHRELADARLALEQALIKYHELNLRHENVTEELEDRKAELMECYQGKTTQYCGFEDDSICGFEQDNGTDDQDWLRWSMSTNSSNTGPSFDHTCQNVRGYYMYVEATTRSEGKRARLKSPRYMGYVEQCVEFYYHMYGRSIGTLNVHTIVPGTNVVPLWRAFGNQGDVWTLARIGIPAGVAEVGYEVVFEAVLENGYAGDLAIDDFRVFDGPCYAQRVSVTHDRRNPLPRQQTEAPGDYYLTTSASEPDDNVENNT